ncbi:transposase [Patescibacteria group bacterium]
MRKYKDKKQYRWQGYDYSREGFYFVTICTKNREFYFGDIVGTQDFAFIQSQPFPQLQATKIGKIAEECWREIPDHFPFVTLDEFVIMPNHIHGIIIIDDNAKTQNVGTQNVGTQNLAFLREYKNQFGPQSKNLSSIIRGFKIGVTKYANNNLKFAWQPRFHDRIIRNDNELNKIRQYIINNPLKWELDRNNPEKLFM